MYIFQNIFLKRPICVLRDRQDEPPAEHCARCGGEIYPAEPAWPGEEGPLCPDCFSRERRERKRIEEE